jgi:hypothetical protein
VGVASLLADDRCEDVHHGEVAALRLDHHVLEGVDATEALGDLVGGELADGLRVALGELPSPGQEVGAGGEPGPGDRRPGRDRGEQYLSGGVARVGFWSCPAGAWLRLLGWMSLLDFSFRVIGFSSGVMEV